MKLEGKQPLKVKSNQISYFRLHFQIFHSLPAPIVMPTKIISDKVRYFDIIPATCYGIKAASYYDVDVVSYGLLADDVKNIESLGNQACREAEACYDQVTAAMQVDFIEISLNDNRKKLEISEAVKNVLLLSTITSSLIQDEFKKF